jgi:hypothetical protein
MPVSGGSSEPGRGDQLVELVKTNVRQLEREEI